MTSFMPDSSCMVAVLSASHVHHTAALGELDGRLDRGEVMLVAAHALVETGAVLTRIPALHRLLPARAREVIEVGLVQGKQVVALEGDEYVRLLRGAPEEGIVSGRIYDALIAACARKQAWTWC